MHRHFFSTEEKACTYCEPLCGWAGILLVQLRQAGRSSGCAKCMTARVGKFHWFFNSKYPRLIQEYFIPVWNILFLDSLNDLVNFWIKYPIAEPDTMVIQNRQMDSKNDYFISEHGKIISEHDFLVSEHSRMTSKHDFFIYEHPQLTSEHHFFIFEHSQMISERYFMLVSKEAIACC